jgi:hypothetical protein
MGASAFGSRHYHKNVTPRSSAMSLKQVLNHPEKGQINKNETNFFVIFPCQTKMTKQIHFVYFRSFILVSLSLTKVSKNGMSHGFTTLLCVRYPF